MILGIEYLKALLQLDSPIIPVCVTRVSNDHHSKELTPSISSATSIREILEQNQIRPLFSRVPEALHDIYQMHYLCFYMQLFILAKILHRSAVFQAILRTVFLRC